MNYSLLELRILDTFGAKRTYMNAVNFVSDVTAQSREVTHSNKSSAYSDSEYGNENSDPNQSTSSASIYHTHKSILPDDENMM